MSQGIFTPSLVSMGSAGRAPEHVTALTQTHTETETVLYLLEKWQLITVGAVHEEGWVCVLGWGGGGGRGGGKGAVSKLYSPAV